MSKEKTKEMATVILWFFIVTLYPALISIYVHLPLFIGFSGLIFILGLEEKNNAFIFLSLLYMLFLEINLSLPLLLLTLATLIFYHFFYKKLDIIKHCNKCIYVICVVAINIIYIILLNINDLFIEQSSIVFNKHILYSILIDILAAVIMHER